MQENSNFWSWSFDQSRKLGLFWFLKPTGIKENLQGGLKPLEGLASPWGLLSYTIVFVSLFFTFFKNRDVVGWECVPTPFCTSSVTWRCGIQAMTLKHSCDLTDLLATCRFTLLVQSCFFFAETIWSFFAETFWWLQHFVHLSHSYIKTCCNNVF